MGMTNHHRTLGSKRHLWWKITLIVAVVRTISQTGEWPNECGDSERRGRVEETCTYANFPHLPELLQGVPATAHQNMMLMYDAAPAHI
ncbi:hypothetical protein TNCV_45411 [Trichonephila clavipes]|nr:hypothetical protein TNCV_45411 [Trichonephila clavipes]